MAPHSAKASRALRAALPTALALLAASLALPAQGGTPEAPEVADASGDAGFAPLDIAAAWFDANATTLRVHLLRAEGSDTPPATVVCQEGTCAGRGVALRVAFTVLKPDGTAAPALKDYASSFVEVRLGPDDAIAGHFDGEGAATVLGPVNVTIDGAAIEVAVPLAHGIVGMPGGLASGYRVSAPYAQSYAMACAPEEGCADISAPVEPVGSLWDRAPDSGTGADYWLPAPVEPDSAETQTATTAPSATTVTVVETSTVTRTETQAVTETVTFTPAGDGTGSKASPAAGILVAFGVVALAAARRRLA